MSLENIRSIVIEKGKGVLDAIVRAAQEENIKFTRKELYTLGKEVCKKLQSEDCVVQPGAVISINPVSDRSLKSIERLHWGTKEIATMEVGPSGKRVYTITGIGTRLEGERI